MKIKGFELTQPVLDLDGKPIQVNLDGKAEELTLRRALRVALTFNIKGDAETLSDEQRFLNFELAAKLHRLDHEGEFEFSKDEKKWAGDRALKVWPLLDPYKGAETGGYLKLFVDGKLPAHDPK